MKEGVTKKLEFYNPIDTKQDILFNLIGKGKREEYEYKGDFEANFNLLFSRLIPYTTIEKEKRENKGKYLQLITKKFSNLNSNSELLNALNNLNSRRKFLINWLQEIGFKCENFTAYCAWRLIIGLGSTHPQETSMTLHHIYGIPYIPGSAIKGVTKHYTILTLADKYKDRFEAKTEREKFSNAVNKIATALDKGEILKELSSMEEEEGYTFEDLIAIFGTQKKRGEVIFMDAYPVENIQLKIDIMNPHYSEYYTQQKPPFDYQNPIPINFLTVENTKFDFILLSKEEGLLEIAYCLLKRALSEFGIGAKTSLGYGLFEDFGR